MSRMSTLLCIGWLAVPALVSGASMSCDSDECRMAFRATFIHDPSFDSQDPEDCSCAEVDGRLSFVEKFPVESRGEVLRFRVVRSENGHFTSLFMATFSNQEAIVGLAGEDKEEFEAALRDDGFANLERQDNECCEEVARYSWRGKSFFEFARALALHVRLPDAEVLEGDEVDFYYRWLVDDSAPEFTSKVTPNFIYSLAGGGWPNDPKLEWQWGVCTVEAPAAWSSGARGSERIVVALVDSGIDEAHVEHRGNLWHQDPPGRNFCERCGQPDDIQDEDGHGTFVAGIVGALTNNGTHFAGLNWNVQMMILRAFGENGRGKGSELSNAVCFAANNGARVIAAPWTASTPQPDMDCAIRRAQKRGALFVTAAGNDSKSVDVGDVYPASFKEDYDNVLVLGGTDWCDGRARVSNFGPLVDLGAPGAFPTWSTWLESEGGIKESGGTSAATAFATGAAALTLAANSELTHQELKERLVEGADSSEYLRGCWEEGRRLNVWNAVRGCRVEEDGRDGRECRDHCQGPPPSCKHDQLAQDGLSGCEVR